MSRSEKSTLPQDLSSLSKPEVSRILYAQIKWEEIMRSGLNLDHSQHQLLERAQNNLSVVLDNKQDVQNYISILIKILETCSDLTIQQYIFTRFEEILGLIPYNYISDDLNTNTDYEAVGLKHAKLFFNTQTESTFNCGFNEKLFHKFLTASDNYLQFSCANVYSALLTQLNLASKVISANSDNSITPTSPIVLHFYSPLFQWVTQKLNSKVSSVWELTLSVINILCRNIESREILAQNDELLILLIKLLKKNVNDSSTSSTSSTNTSNSQVIYEILVILWSIFLTKKYNEKIIFSSNLILLLHTILLNYNTKKIVRVIISSLKNLIQLNNIFIINEILSLNIIRTLEKISNGHLNNVSGANIASFSAITSINELFSLNPSSNAFLAKQFDEEFLDEFNYLYYTLLKNYHDLTNYDSYCNEMLSGNITWSFLHTEKFWRENNKKFEEGDFKMIKILLTYLDDYNSTKTIDFTKNAGVSSNDKISLNEDAISTTNSITTKLSIILYDLGEFARFYPNGRVILSRLNGREKVMRLLSHEDEEVQRHTLQCISKLMVNNWEYLR